ncbi:hypothetical protein BV20DRAFT_1050153 [Pilatotrama ljubarskyi]|nr:hypothetical protein BV20DRAFT_1050153 [Pilatotrama ljubarskyi]
MSTAVLTTLNNVLNQGADLANNIAQVASKPIPKPASDLQEKYRWLQCTLKNETQFDIVLLDTYFDSGRYWTAPGNVNAFDQMVWSACNRDDSVFTGVAGGTGFRIMMDANNYHDFAVGYTNPTIGAYKAGVAVASGKGVDGYELADSAGRSGTTKAVYEGKDKDGNPVKFRFLMSGSPGQEPLFIVKQVML